MSDVKVFMPDVLRYEDSAILTANHLGAVVAGDTGKDAQYLANANGMRVIAQDRPGTGSYLPAAPSEVSSQREATRDWAEAIKPYLEADGIYRLHAFARSAAAILMLEVTAMEELPIVGVGAVEPIGWENMTRREGYAAYAKYQMGTELRHHDPVEETETAEADEEEATAKLSLGAHVAALGHGVVRAAGMGKRQISDIRHNRDIWRTDIAYKSARHIAHYMPATPLLLTFAEQPMGAPRAVVEGDLARLIELRGKRSGHIGWTAVEGELIPGTTHGSFDNSERYDQQFKKLLALSEAS